MTRLLARLREADRAVIVPMALLLLVGLVLVRSATADARLPLLGRQVQWIVVALVFAVPLVLIPYTRMLRHAPLFYAGIIGLLVLVKVAAPVINGSQRWLVFGGFQIQPSEPAKLLTVLLLARMLRFGRTLDRFRDLFRPLAVALLPMALVLMQPDLGTALLFLPVGVAILVVSGAPMRSLVLLALLGLIVGGAAFQYGLRSYQRERILSTFQHEQLTRAQLAASGFQLEQSLIAIGNGGIVGRGHREGPRTQAQRLPEAHSDFIFAVLAEEHGLVGAAGLMGLTALLVGFIFQVGARTRDPAGRLICVGVGTLIGAQALVHAMVTLGLAPTTGMPYPFVSAGGSSLVTCVAAVALVLNVSVNRPRVPIATRIRG